MSLALSILFLWIGLALLYVAFHPPSEKTLLHPVDAAQEVVDAIGSSAYQH